MNIFLVLIFVLNCSLAYAVTDTFREGVSGYAGTSDATILSSSTNQHITDLTSMRGTDVGIYYLLGFVLTTIPTNATVSSATIELQVSEQNCTDETMGVRKIEDPDSSGMFDDNEAAADVFNDYATWANKDHGVPKKWEVAGGGANFTDVDDNAEENTQTSGVCPGFVSRTWTITTMVQNWVTTPASNTGMVFILASTGNVSVKNKRDGTSTNRPLLTVIYTVPSGTDIKVNTDLKIETDFKI